MLKGLITSLLVSMGVVSPTTNTPSFNMIQHKENKTTIRLNITNNTYSQTLMGDNLTTEQDEHIINQDEYYNYMSQTTFYKGTTYNSYFSTTYNEIIQMKGRGQQTQIDEYITEDPKDTTQFTIIQLNNYRYLYESTIDLIYKTYIRTGLPNGTKIRTYCLATSENLSTYINIQNWSVYEQTSQMWEEIISPERGFLYEMQYTENTLEQDTQPEEYDISFTDIPILNNVTNYIVLYTYLILPTTSYSNTYVLSSYTPNYVWIKNNQVNMSGQFVIPADNYEIIDIPGFLWLILTMPFSFISTAFNLTLFPGTPYQVNISQLFLVLIGLLVFIWIIKKLIQAK